MSLVDQTLAQYRELRGRVDEKFSEIRAARPADFVCRLGCHSCCKSGLTVNPLEREEIARFLAERPDLERELRALAAENPHRGKRCSFLDASGACGIYEARPLVCRSHGAPLQFRLPPAEQFRLPPAEQLRPLDSRDENLRARDVCPLNFTGSNLAEVPAEQVLNLDTLNTLLALLSRRAFPQDDSRTPLTAEAVTK